MTNENCLLSFYFVDSESSLRSLSDGIEHCSTSTGCLPFDSSYGDNSFGSTDSMWFSTSGSSDDDEVSIFPQAPHFINIQGKRFVDIG